MKRIFTIIALALLTCIVYAQNDTIVVNNQRYVVVKEAPQQEKQVTTTPKKNKFWTKDKITYGGGFGFNLNKYEFHVMVMPEIGYQLFFFF